MLRNYNDIEKLKTVYEDIKNINLKPEYLLISYLNMYDKELLDDIYNITVLYGYYGSYICNILFTYKIPYIGLIFSKNNIYLNDFNYKKYTELGNIIDICKDSNILFIYHYNENENEKNNLKNINSGINNYNEFIKDVKNKNAIIKINNFIYKLDSCIICNYNSFGEHIIAGITCNNNKYIIDSLDKYNYSSKINSYTYKYKYSSCKPLYIDGIYHQHFVFKMIVI